LVENIIRIVFYEERRNTKIKKIYLIVGIGLIKKDLEKHRQLLIVN